MNRYLKKIIVASLLTLAVLTVGTDAAFAQATQCGQKRDVGGKALDEATFKQLNKVYEDVGEERSNPFCL